MEIGNLLDKADRNREAGDWAEGKLYYEVAISRYYYCLYQKAIYISRTRNYINVRDRYSHKEFIEDFINSMESRLNDTDFGRLNRFPTLRQIRNIADYKINMLTEYDYKMSFKLDFKYIDEILTRLTP